MHHLKTYICINVQQNRVSRSVSTVHKKIFVKNANCITLQQVFGHALPPNGHSGRF